MALRRRRQWWLLLVGLCTACGGEDKPAAAPEPVTDVVEMTIRTTHDTNRGTALHVLIRETSKVDYPRVQYEDVANTLLADSDPKTLDWLVVLPGQAHEVRFTRPKGAAIAVYCLFTDPGRRWKALVNENDVERVELVIGRDQITDARIVGGEGGTP